ncbi:hypothetical protein BV20DRAFT_975619 [Pilatotrama ljubarskyi]|nr:hypothetical protein BV20DRAFT_975619 [Pilatotrama ljubarskyi]
MSVSQLVAPTLPAEIIDAIIDILHDDWQALATCASISTVWRSQALFHLSKGVTISARRPPFSEASRFMEVFHPESLLADVLTALVVRGRGRSVDLPYMLHLAHLRNLRSLSLVGLMVRSSKKLQNLFASCTQALEELCLDRLGLVSAPRASSSRRMDDYQALSHGICAFPQLRTLRLRFSGANSGSAVIHNAVRHSLMHGAWSSIHLHTLSLHILWHESVLLYWAPIVTRMQESLQVARVTLRRPLDPDHSFDSALAQCAGLQSLTLCINPVEDAQRAHYPDILASLAAWLMPPRCLFTRSLHELTIILHYPMQPMLSHSSVTRTAHGLLTDFAGVLLPSTYPHLSGLKIFLYDDASDVQGPQSDLQYAGTSHMVETPLREEHVASITSALRPLQDGGVRVEVQHAASFATLLDAAL